MAKVGRAADCLSCLLKLLGLPNTLQGADDSYDSYDSYGQRTGLLRLLMKASAVCRQALVLATRTAVQGSVRRN